MGWLDKILKGSSHKISAGQYHGKYEDEKNWDGPSTSADAWSDFEQEDIDLAIAFSLAEEDEKGKKIIDVEPEPHVEEDGQLTKSVEEDGQLAKALEEDEQLAKALEEDEQLAKHVEEDVELAKHVEEDEQLAKALQESLNIEYPPQHDHGNLFQPYPYFYPSGICAGCNTEIGHGRFLSCMGAVWHPECFRCHACNRPISDYEFSMSENRPFHKSCYKERHHPRCDVCKNYSKKSCHDPTHGREESHGPTVNASVFPAVNHGHEIPHGHEKSIPTNMAGLIEYRALPFWEQKYCPSHEHDRTPRCCSCERMEPRDTRYLLLDDGRKLCLECLDSAVMDTHEFQPLYLEIQEFYEGLNMKVEQQIPLLLVERQALNEAMEGEKNGHHHMPETRGLCLSEEQTISTISRRPTIGAGHRIIDMFTEPYRLIRQCEVTAILILYSLPRLLTGSILAHEMMHAWLRLKGYPNLSPDVEEGICQVLAHMWLDSEIMAGSGSGSNVASTSSSSSSSGATSSKKGKRSEFEKKLGDFFKRQIESDTSKVYGEGFREGNKAVLKYGLKRTLDHIRLTGCFP